MNQLFLKFLPLIRFSKPASPAVNSLQGTLTQSERAFFMARSRQMIGQWAEDLASSFLSSQGLRIIARNVRERFSELDLVCRDGRELVFVEVRCRSKNGIMAAEETLGRHKWQRLCRGAELYTLKNKWNGSWRIDLISVNVDYDKWHLKWLRYLEMEE